MRLRIIAFRIGVLLIILTILLQISPIWQKNVPKIILEPQLNEKRMRENIVKENERPGSIGWKITSPGHHHIQGYASNPSVKAGSQISFHVHSEKPFSMQVYRMGYYQGLGGRIMYTKTGCKEYKQKVFFKTSEGCAWLPNYSLKIPASWPSGFYLNKLTDTKGRASYIPFVVRDEESSKADYVVLLATNTYQAYNNWGGKSLYAYNSTFGKQGKMVSYNRPYSSGEGAGLFFQFEYNLIRWLEKEGYHLTYICDVDVHQGILEQSKAKALIIAGHAEYWSMEMRRSIEKVTASRMNLANFSANVGYWQVRIDPDENHVGNPYLVSYKQFATSQDPFRFINSELVTTRFRDKPVSLPEDRVLGTMYIGIPEKVAPLRVTNPSHWLYKGTGLKRGDEIPGVVGGEVDGYYNLPGGEVIAGYPVMLYGKKRDATVVWYNKPTGRKAFSVGTFYWNWFLDPINHLNQAHENKQIQQITRNALRELVK